jgi:hypothetical protein
MFVLNQAEMARQNYVDPKQKAERAKALATVAAATDTPVEDAFHVLSMAGGGVLSKEEEKVDGAAMGAQEEEAKSERGEGGSLARLSEELHIAPQLVSSPAAAVEPHTLKETAEVSVNNIKLRYPSPPDLSFSLFCFSLALCHLIE